VQVISSQDIQNSGMTTISDVIRTLSADNSGTLPAGFGDAFAAGATGVALRGLTVGSTLVLIDGRRSANYALDDDGVRSFVDLSTIPLDSVDHIEVLKDGASSLYGADAIGGVVNVILKKSIQGGNITAEGGTSQHGGGSTRKIAASYGVGDLAADRYNAYVDIEYEQDDRLAVRDRGFPFNTNNLSSVGGNNNIGGQPGQFSGSVVGSVTPGTLGTPGNLLTGVPLPGALAQPLGPCTRNTFIMTDSTGTYCAENLVNKADDAPADKRLNLTSRFTVQINDDTQAYTSLMYSRNDVNIVAPGFPYPQIQTSVPTNTNSIALPPTLPTGALNPNNPFAALGEYALINYSFGDLPTANHEVDQVVRLTDGVTGKVLGWDYDTAVVIAHTWLATTETGLLNYPALINAVTNGTYNFITPSLNSAATLAALSPALQKTSTTDMDSIDFRVTRNLFQMPGGPFGVALGTELRHEAQYDPNINASTDVQSLGAEQTIGSRMVYAAYGEVGIPIVKMFEVDVSGRYDHYSDFGGNFAPKAGFKFQPIEQVALRGTYSQGFRAPSFAENGSSSNEGFVTYTLPASFIAAHGADGYTNPYSLAEYTAANPNVKPEKSKSYTLGLVFQPIKPLSATVDFYDIQKTNYITAGNDAPALAAYFAGQPIPAGDVITPDNPDPAFPAALARPSVVSVGFVNAASLHTNGFDVDLKLALDHLGFIDHFVSDISTTEIVSYVYTPNGASPQQYVGTQGPYNLSSGAGTPKYRATWDNTVVIGPGRVSLNAYYTSGQYMFGPDLAPPYFCFASNNTTGANYPPNCHTPGFLDFDLTGGYQITPSLSATGAVENLFDRSPPFNPINYAGVNYNPTYAQAGIIGRFFRVSLSYKF
jgi:iron complex outermembrane receptor protein